MTAVMPTFADEVGEVERVLAASAADVQHILNQAVHDFEGPFPEIYWAYGKGTDTGSDSGIVYYPTTQEPGLIIGMERSLWYPHWPSLVILTPDGQIGQYEMAEGTKPRSNLLQPFPSKNRRTRSNPLTLRYATEALQRLTPRPVLVRSGKAPDKVANPGEEFCWKCGHVGPAQDFYLEGRCLASDCQESDWNRPPYKPFD